MIFGSDFLDSIFVAYGCTVDFAPCNYNPTHDYYEAKDGAKAGTDRTEDETDDEDEDRRYAKVPAKVLSKNPLTKVVAKSNKKKVKDIFNFDKLSKRAVMPRAAQMEMDLFRYAKNQTGPAIRITPLMVGDNLDFYSQPEHAFHGIIPLTGAVFMDAKFVTSTNFNVDVVRIVMIAGVNPDDRHHFHVSGKNNTKSIGCDAMAYLMQIPTDKFDEFCRVYTDLTGLPFPPMADQNEVEDSDLSGEYDDLFVQTQER